MKVLKALSIALLKALLRASKIFIACVCSFTIIVFIVAFLSPYSYGREYSVFEQYNNKWISEDSKIMIVSHDVDEPVELIIRSDDEEYVFTLSCKGRGGMLYGYDKDMVAVELWRPHYYKDKIQISVYDSMFFERNDEIILYLVV